MLVKKLISYILIIGLLLTGLPAFAEETSQPADKEPVVTEEQIAAEETQVTDEEIEEVIDISGEEELVAEEEQVLEELDIDKEITGNNAPRVLKNLYKYMVKRDKYYKRVLTVIDKVYQTEDKTVRKLAIIEFEKRYAAEKERDRKIHHKIIATLKFLKENRNKLTDAQQKQIKRIFKPVIIKYLQHRKIIIHVHLKLQEVKRSCLEEDIKKITVLAEQARARGDLKKAGELYEKVIARGGTDAQTYKQAGTVLNQVYGKGPKVFVEGARPNFDVQPVIKQGRTLVPLRAIAEALKAKVDWNPKTKIVIMIKGDITVQLPIDKKIIIINGKQKAVDVAATIINNRTLVPLRTVSETLDADVTWDDETQLITIEDNLTEPTQDVTSTQIAETGLGASGEFTNGATSTEIIDEVINLDESKIDEQIALIE